MSRFQCFLIVAAAMFPLGCNSGGLSASETNAILTVFNQDFNYASPRTYALSGEVVDLCKVASEVTGEGGASSQGGAGGEGGSLDPRFDSTRCTRHSSSLDDEVMEAVETQMDALGYRKVKSVDDADLVVLTSAVTRSYWFHSSGYQICDELLGDSCWDPTPSYSFALPYGSLLITWIDAEALRAGDVESVWFAAVPGVFGSYAPRGSASEISAAVAQAYRQSPYLGGGP